MYIYTYIHIILEILCVVNIGYLKLLSVYIDLKLLSEGGISGLLGRYMYVCMYAWVCMYVCMYVCIHIYIYIYIYI
jgi:hypothetical protein